MEKLVRNPHLCLSVEPGEITTVAGDYDYWHYICDGTDDRGWGCGYRTLQTIISWCIHNSTSSASVPSIREIQEVLVKMEDKPKRFVGSREWIGSVEIGLVIDFVCDIPVKIVHVTSGAELPRIFPALQQHFTTRKCPVMMGGDQDCSSKGIFGTREDGNKKFLLVVDPHYVSRGKETKGDKLIQEGWIKWVELSDFMDSSFYNLALPQTKPS